MGKYGVYMGLSGELPRSKGFERPSKKKSENVPFVFLDQDLVSE